MSVLKYEINELLVNECDYRYTISFNDVNRAIKKLKSGKDDGSEGLLSDHVINASQKFYNMLSLVYSAMLVHGIAPNSMLLATMVPIPKNKRKSLCDSDNYRSIALSSILGKVFDLIVLDKEQAKLVTSDLQFGFKDKSSTTQCTYVLNETIKYYNYKSSNAYVLMLDATKAFDRVQYTACTTIRPVCFFVIFQPNKCG